MNSQSLLKEIFLFKNYIGVIIVIKLYERVFRPVVFPNAVDLVAGVSAYCMLGMAYISITSELGINIAKTMEILHRFHDKTFVSARKAVKSIFTKFNPQMT